MGRTRKVPVITSRVTNEVGMLHGNHKSGASMIRKWLAWTALAAVLVPTSPAQTPSPAPAPVAAAKRAPAAAIKKAAPRPKLVLLLVVDQMRGDYVDKFLHQWTGGLPRLVDEGAWFHGAAYPYATTQTCVGHGTISPGSFPGSPGWGSNSWWDVASRQMAACTGCPHRERTCY